MGVLDMIARGWDDFLARPEGPVNLRFIIQPAMASIIAIRAGLKDATAGRPAYLWRAVTNAESRTELLHDGWTDMWVPVLVGATLDAIYQIIVHRWVYPIELLFTVTLLALVPYLLLRGPVNRIAKMFSRTDSSPQGR